MALDTIAGGSETSFSSQRLTRHSFRCMYFAVPFSLFFPHLPLTAANIVRCYDTSPKTTPVSLSKISWLINTNLREQQLFCAVAYVLKVRHTL